MNKKGWVVLFVVLVVVGFNDRVYSASKSPDPTKDMTLTEAMKKLQERGELPVLDTTDTLAGIDADGDGIRDDIQAFVDKLDVSNEQRRFFRELAKAEQAVMLVDSTDKMAVKAVEEKIMKSAFCLISVPDTDEDITTKYTDQLEAYTRNTKIRFEQSDKVDAAYSGSVYLVPDHEECDK